MNDGADVTLRMRDLRCSACCPIKVWYSEHVINNHDVPSNKGLFTVLFSSDTHFHATHNLYYAQIWIE